MVLKFAMNESESIVHKFQTNGQGWRLAFEAIRVRLCSEESLLLKTVKIQCPKWPVFQFSTFYPLFKGARNPYIFKFLAEVLEDPGGS